MNKLFNNVINRLINRLIDSLIVMPMNVTDSSLDPKGTYRESTISCTN